MTEEIIREYSVGEFRGTFPDVDIAPGVDMEALKELDANPFFATLPIVPEVGVVSGNGLLYDEELVNSLERQINDKRPGGIFGHLKEGERDSSFPLPSGLWVGAKRVGQTLWGKVYLPPGQGREHIRTLKAVGGEISTSIYGKGTFEKVRDGVRRLTDFKLESLDFAPPSRAALGYAATPHVTREMNQEQEPTMADKIEVLNEMRAVKVPANKGWQGTSDAPQEPQDEEGEVSEMSQIRETLGIPEGVNVLEVVTELRGQIDYFRQKEIDARISELVTEGVKLSSARAIITKLIGTLKPATVEEAEAAYQQVVEMAEVKELLALQVRAASGPSAIVNGKVRDARPALVDTPENRQRAVAALGINI